MRYTYDAWNRLVKVTRKQDTDIVIQTAEYDGLGRRVQKVVAKSGDLDGTFSYFYDGWKIVQINTGAEVYQQVYHGTQYIDEIVAMRLEKGYAVVYQAEADQGGRAKDWNTVATCDLAGRVLERVFTTPYGSPIIEPETFFGDYGERSERERAATGKAGAEARVRHTRGPRGASTTRATCGGDGDVDSTDDASLGSSQTCWGTPSGACRVFDFNQDGTLNASDETVMTTLVAAPSTNRRHESRTVSPTGMAFLHQGLLVGLQLMAYENRSRQYLPTIERFAQKDAMGYLDGQNSYCYLKNSPVSLIDPSGFGQVCVDTSCAVAPPGSVIPETQPPPTIPLPAPGTCVAADGLVLGGQMHKVRLWCKIVIKCSGGTTSVECSGFLCDILGWCIECDPGYTICDCTCVRWGDNGDWIDCRRPGVPPTRCLEWNCKPDPPFNLPGFGCGSRPGQHCGSFP